MWLRGNTVIEVIAATKSNSTSTFHLSHPNTLFHIQEIGLNISSKKMTATKATLFQVFSVVSDAEDDCSTDRLTSIFNQG
jgi:hypothetical protein